MLSDEELLSIYHGDDKHGHIWMGGAHGAGLRAVEAAVRADEREQVVREIENFRGGYNRTGNTYALLTRVATAIRSQLDGGN